MAHWYLPNGELIQYVPNASKPGTLRPYTLRDARKDKAFPSTTTKLQLLNKFLLNEWIKKETIKLAITEASKWRWEAIAEPELFSIVYNDVLKKSEETISWSANFGTRVHKSVSALFGGEPYEEPELDELDLIIADNVVAISKDMLVEYGDFTKVKAVAEATKEWMDANGFECLKTEETIVDKELGIAGTPDWIGFHYDNACVVDVKTQDAESTKDFHLWEEFPLQLADYTKALCNRDFWGLHGNPPEVWQKEEVERISVLTSRTNPGVIMPYQWSDADDFKKMDMISELYFLSHKYDPRRESSDPIQESLI